MWFLSLFVYFYPFCTFFSLLSLYSVPLYFPLPFVLLTGLILSLLLSFTLLVPEPSCPP